MESKKEIVTKTYKVRLSPNASGNIDDIAKYIALTNNQPINGAKVVDKIFEAIDRIGDHPLAFKECDEIPTKNKIYRRAICMSWVIIYKITGYEIVILGVISSAMKPSRIRAIKKVK